MLLPLDDVFVDRNFNVRIFYGDVDGLALSLMTEGQREPVTVRRDGLRYIVVDGHRRHRALARARALEIVALGSGFELQENGRPLRPAPGPVHARFMADHLLCRVAEGEPEPEVFASQLTHNSGKPFTLLERMLLVSRLARMDPSISREQLALRTGFSRTYVANAQQLHAADPRLLEFVREGTISQKLALRLLKAFPAGEQVARVSAGADAAAARGRDKILPKDIEWPTPAPRGDCEEAGDEPVKSRLCTVVRRLEGADNFAPNPTAAERIGTLRWVHGYACGKVSYARFEAYLFGRE